MIDRNTGKPTRAKYQCRYCGHITETSVNLRPLGGNCPRGLTKEGGNKIGRHVWVLIKKC